MSREKDLSEKVADVVNEVEDEERNDDNIITLSSGVKIRLKPVNQHFIFQVMSKFKPPKVPVIHDKKKGRDEENPNDPDYQNALEQYVADQAQAGNDTCLLRGIDVVETPKGFMKHDSAQWKEEMEILGIPTDSERLCYLSWLKAIAIPTHEELNTVLEGIGRLTGVTEADIASAAEGFRGDKGGGEDRQSGDMD